LIFLGIEQLAAREFPEPEYMMVARLSKATAFLLLKSSQVSAVKRDRSLGVRLKEVLLA